MKKLRFCIFLILYFVTNIEGQACAGGNVCGDGYCCKYSSGCECSHVVCREMCFHGDSMPNEISNLPKPGQYDNRMVSNMVLSTDGDFAQHLATAHPHYFYDDQYNGGGSSKGNNDDSETDAGEGAETETPDKGDKSRIMFRRRNQPIRIYSTSKRHPKFSKQKARMAKKLQLMRRQKQILQGVNVPKSIK